MQAWDAELYRSRHGFVADLAMDLLSLLAPEPGERVLDLGCGVGVQLTELVRAGASVVGVDADPAMVEAARLACPEADVRLADARELRGLAGFDALLSNAVLHWVKPPEQAARAMARVLVPGGRLVVELGGAGNLARVCDALVGALSAQGVAEPRARLPWYFPSLGAYTSLLEGEGFLVRSAWTFERPTRLADGRAGLGAWLRMFASPLLALAPEPARALADIERELEGSLWRGDHWALDYVRLRVMAVRAP